MARAWLETNQPEQALPPARVAAETQVPGGREVLIDAMIANGKGETQSTARRLRGAVGPWHGDVWPKPAWRPAFSRAR